MAKQKRSVFVQQLPNFLRVWCDNPERWMTELMTIEGIANAWLSSNGFVDLSCDPRYDISELAQEVEQLLNAEVPDDFAECLGDD